MYWTCLNRRKFLAASTGAVAGAAHRNRPAFEKTFARIVEAMRGACDTEGPQRR